MRGFEGEIVKNRKINIKEHLKKNLQESGQERGRDNKRKNAMEERPLEGEKKIIGIENERELRDRREASELSDCMSDESERKRCLLKKKMGGKKKRKTNRRKNEYAEREREKRRS